MVEGVVFLASDERVERVTLHFVEAVNDVSVGGSHGPLHRPLCR